MTTNPSDSDVFSNRQRKVLHLLPTTPFEDRVGTGAYDVYYRSMVDPDLIWLGMIIDGPHWQWQATNLYRNITEDDTPYAWTFCKYKPPGIDGG